MPGSRSRVVWLSTVGVDQPRFLFSGSGKSVFVLSGFLIFMSYDRSSSFFSYASKRSRRIYPAYFTVVMLCAIGLVAVSSKDFGGYFSSDWVKYTLANLTFLNFLQPKLPGVFEANKLGAVNGSLWTLKIEVMFYLTVPCVKFLFRRFSVFSILVFLYCSSVIYSCILTAIAERTGSSIYFEISRQLPGQLSYFMSGAFFYYFLPLFERYKGHFLAAASLVLIANMFLSLTLLEPFSLATIVIFFGLFLYAGNVGKFGDFSYGIYILHFPIIQIFLHAGWFQQSPLYFLIMVTLATIVCAIAMWHTVEKWFLFRGNHYVKKPQSSEEGISNPSVDTNAAK